MSVCIAAQYPWPQIRHLRGLEPPGVVVLSDTRLSSSGGRVLPWVAAKQGSLKRNIFVCYTSSNVAVTSRALAASVASRDVKRIGSTLRDAHERYGGATELLVVVWRRKMPPQVLELMPPLYRPQRRTGVVGIGDRAVLGWFKDILPDLKQVEKQQEFLEAMRERMHGAVLPEHRYGIEKASMQLVAAFHEAILRAGGPTVGLPVQVAIIHLGRAWPLNAAMTADLEHWEEVAILPSQVNVPSFRLVRTPVDRSPRSAIQLFET